MAPGTPRLEVRDLSVTVCGAGPAQQAVLRRVSLRLEAGECVALVGESGCGKTTLALALLGLLPAGLAATAGAIGFEGEDVLCATPARRAALRGSGLALMLQEPATALDPMLDIGVQIDAMLRAHTDLDRGQRVEATRRLLDEVGLPADVSTAVAHRLSGGMRQRALIALVLAAQPRLLIADEPTSAIDAVHRRQILELLRRVQRQRGMALLLITHDLTLAASHADRLVVLYAGEVVEEGPAEALLAGALHPYTRALFGAMDFDPRQPASFVARPLAGQPPRPGERADAGCAFLSRCQAAREHHSSARCAVTHPPLAATLHADHRVRCLLHLRSAVK